MRSGAKVAIVGGVFAVVAGGIGYGAYNVVDAVTGTGTRAGSSTVKTGPPSADEVRETVKGFLDAWAAGDERAAAELTDNAAEAQPAIAGYREDAHITKATFTTGTAVGAKVPFRVTAQVTYEGRSKPWEYESELTVVRGATTGKALVDWQPTVVHPDLRKGERLMTGPASAPPVKALDRDGVELTREKYPSLGPVLDGLREKYGQSAGGESGVELVIDGGDGGAPDRSLLTLTEGKPGELRTTLDAKVQAAAERAVKRYDQASVVAIQPSTGKIRAVANNRDDGFNAAMQGTLAPGSTMKIVTAAMLMEKGLVAADKPAECPPEAIWGGRAFTNLKGFSLPEGTTFARSFAKSCNTAFIKLIDDTKDESALSKEATEVFGIGLDWKTGIASFDGRVPETTGADAAAAYIGQGQVQMNPLNIASITATAKSGVFKQPILVSAELDDRPIARAARRLPDSVARQLRDMMRLTATSGTGATAMAGLGGDKGAKTGSAEVDGKAASDSWFTGFRDDLAAAAVVQSGGHGGDAAGPVVATVLGAG
ncbi:penicillin-binding transpeptidase domain-containing protein [Streptomyces sannanensis]